MKLYKNKVFIQVPDYLLFFEEWSSDRNTSLGRIPKDIRNLVKELLYGETGMKRLMDYFNSEREEDDFSFIQFLLVENLPSHLRYIYNELKRLIEVSSQRIIFKCLTLKTLTEWSNHFSQQYPLLNLAIITYIPYEAFSEEEDSLANPEEG